MSTDQPTLSVAAVALMKGVVYRDTHEQVWHHVVRLQPQLRDHMAVLGLDVVVDEAEGYAYLRSQPEDPDDPDPIPRLVPRHRLSFPVSLLLALLRKALAEFDATSGEDRLVLTRDQIIEDLRVFLADSTNEARIVDQADRTIAKVVELGFLRPVGGAARTRTDTWEVRRILKAFIDAQWLSDFDARLAEYAAELGSVTEAPPGGASPMQEEVTA
ncbi:MAG TPA: DUF4194 domain-containing protein [Segeticoccus sp.]|uniref:DUF4194 domain-containing protein n=1 Tax=Segeticoccus sp. TaxID=2706531 RepID=UPI002D7F1F68|nr:DUF4194 domain-containing protein [Segeticoccus sp.]HET8600501.1 DUF4194 domain-containing protein [Segeticoccus sp.]